MPAEQLLLLSSLVPLLMWTRAWVLSCVSPRPARLIRVLGSSCRGAPDRGRTGPERPTSCCCYFLLLLHLLASSFPGPSLFAAAVRLWPGLNASLKALISKTLVQMVIIALMRSLPGEDACLFFWWAIWERSSSDIPLQQPLAGLLDLLEGPRLRRLTANGCQ